MSKYWSLKLRNVKVEFHPTWEHDGHLKGYIGVTKIDLEHFPKLLQKWMVYIISKIVMKEMYPGDPKGWEG